MERVFILDKILIYGIIFIKYGKYSGLILVISFVNFFSKVCNILSDMVIGNDFSLIVFLMLEENKDIRWLKLENIGDIEIEFIWFYEWFKIC